METITKVRVGNLEKAMELCKAPESFEELCQNDLVRVVLGNASEKNLEKIINLSKTPEEFKNLWEEEYSTRIVRSPEKNLDFAFNFYNIKNSEDFKKLAMKKEVVEMLQSPPGNLDSAFNLYNIKTTEDFENFLKGDDRRWVFTHLGEKQIQFAQNFYQIKDSKKFDGLCNNYDLIDELYSLTEKDMEKIEKWNINLPLDKKTAIIMAYLPEYKKIASGLIENIRTARRQTLPPDLIKYIAFPSLIIFKKLSRPIKEVDKEFLKKLQEKQPKIYKSILQRTFYIPRLIPGLSVAKRVSEKRNRAYLSAAKELKTPFDLYGILGKDLEGIKKEVEERAGELIEDFPDDKEKFLPYLDSLLGYAAKYKKQVKEILRIDNLWDFKFSHLGELNSILNSFKDLKEIIGKEEKEKEIKTYIQHLEVHLQDEEFSEAKKRIDSLGEKKEKAMELIDEMRGIIETLKKGEIPDAKRVDIIFSNRPIFEALNLSLSLGSIKGLYNELKEKEKGKIFLESVEILKKPEEYLAAINIEPSCMGVSKDYDYGALTIAQGPILILGLKDSFGRIPGRALLIPVREKKTGKWLFELKNTYGIGDRHIESFANKIEKVLKENNKDYYEGIKRIVTKELIEGELPKSKSISPIEQLQFYRDGKKLVSLEKEK
jgi:hypothetical protein